MPSCILLYTPCPDSDTARTLATALLNERLVACCNILPAGESHYWWNGTLTHADEHILLAKTTPEKAPAAAARLEALHPYECPAILRLEAEANSPFAQWVAAETHDPAKS